MTPEERLAKAILLVADAIALIAHRSAKAINLTAQASAYVYELSERGEG